MTQRKSEQQKAAEGTDRKYRKRREWAPQPLEEAPPAPPALDHAGSVLWDRIAGCMVRGRVLVEEDLLSLETLCEIYSRLCKVRRLIRRYGMTMTRARGDRVANPLLSTEVQLCGQLRQYMREHGLTPYSRNYISPAAPPEEADALGEWLAGSAEPGSDDVGPTN